MENAAGEPPSVAAQPAALVLTSTITCPRCGWSATETMPTDACRYLYACRRCGHEMKPRPGDCCVFCSYGDVPCPPIQAERGTGGGCCSR